MTNILSSQGVLMPYSTARTPGIKTNSSIVMDMVRRTKFHPKWGFNINYLSQFAETDSMSAIVFGPNYNVIQNGAVTIKHTSKYPVEGSSRIKLAPPIALVPNLPCIADGNIRGYLYHTHSIDQFKKDLGNLLTCLQLCYKIKEKHSLTVSGKDADQLVKFIDDNGLSGNQLWKDLWTAAKIGLSEHSGVDISDDAAIKHKHQVELMLLLYDSWGFKTKDEQVTKLGTSVQVLFGNYGTYNLSSITQDLTGHTGGPLMKIENGTLMSIENKPLGSAHEVIRDAINVNERLAQALRYIQYYLLNNEDTYHATVQKIYTDGEPTYGQNRYQGTTNNNLEIFLC